MEKMKKLNNDDELKSNTTSVERAVALIKRSPTEEILTFMPYTYNPNRIGLNPKHDCSQNHCNYPKSPD